MEVCDVSGTRRKRKRRRRSRNTGPSCVEDHQHQVDQHQLLKHRGASKRKRPLMDGKNRQFPCQRTSWVLAHKTALVHLNELRPGLHYEVTSKTGPPHAPVFSVGVDVNGFHFVGRGATKKEAKMRAAEMALKSFIQFPVSSHVHTSLEDTRTASVDFTEDHLDYCDVFCSEDESCTFITEKNSFIMEKKKEIFSSKFTQVLSTSLLEQLSPLALLDKLRPGLQYFCLTEQHYSRPTRSFMVVVRVEGRFFEGCSHSKRLAKEQAAAAVLRYLYNVSVGPGRTLMDLHSATRQLPQFFAESIFQLVTLKHDQLMHDGLSAHKVMAAIVMTTGFDLRSAEVVSMATGTKCLNVCSPDCAVSDCHAEVICRRALLIFFYAQLELLSHPEKAIQEESIFVPTTGHSVFRLRDGIRFHMYVTSSPCGDARLNCPYETNALHSRKLRCRLRKKVIGGEGTLPVRAHRKRGAVSSGKPAGSMSCTDKIAKWCVVGLQGALLSHLLEPVYLYSLIVGTLNHTGHLDRVLTRRLAPIRRPSFPYRRQQLLLACVSSSERRAGGEAWRVSVNWSLGDGDVEMISASSGRRIHCGTPSRLSRRRLFACWQSLHKQLRGWTSEDAMRTHAGWKEAAGRYQGVKQQFKRALQGAGFGLWIRKCPEEEGHVDVTEG
ncbi:double-stranded RNA-specific editase B2-like isoform X2 [Dunckerocampus dactyliophorus]|uniref:double-stranded RNA-specific editase B2-like isoform X2 n=1 Tax=Dunckerocampus dactyliophorus TaxID=161453 RepID=UPI0024055BAB|nr:double-stranded RNA-specific editase B2-like isoform X2 [Dunckerocampus dactyliophorus]